MNCLRLFLVAVAFVALVAALPQQGLKSWDDHPEMYSGDDSLLAVTDEMIARINSDSQPGWVAGHNDRFVNATIANAKVLMGTLQNTNKDTWLPYRGDLAPVELPTEFDWRTDPRAANCPTVKEIRDQANCGSCWAFGSVEAMSDRACILTNGSKSVHLSAQDVASCDHMGDMGCSGGVPSTVYSYSHSFGVVDGGNYGDKSMCWSYQLAPCAHHINGSSYKPCPAEVSAPSCARKCENGKSWEGSKHRGGAGYSVCKQGSGVSCADQMAQEIFQNGPITGMFFVKQDFLAYKSGVYTPSWFSPLLGGHAIKIMGFGTEGGVKYWLVANSWNTGWGDGGYFKIKRGVNAAMIESAIINGGPVAGLAA